MRTAPRLPYLLLIPPPYPMAAPDPNARQLARALADVLNEALAQGQAVDVPGLGTFRRRHRPGHITERDGQTVMLPPADVIEFQPLAR